MKQLVSILMAVILLTGCTSILDRSYVTVEEHSSKYWESKATETLRAENYQDIVNDLLLLIGQHTETATLRLYNSEQVSISAADDLERAATEVQQETPMGAYAVEYITCTGQAQRGYYEASIQISYRRSAEQIQSIVNATSAAALPNLLGAALDDGKQELAVRIGYWSDEAASIDSMIAQIRDERGLTDAPEWIVSCYPSAGEVGLIEFQFTA